MTVRVLIVDDEAPARAKLRTLLGEHDDMEIVAEAKDGNEAVAAIRSHQPDLVFLDIQMPGKGGFAVVDEVGVEAMPLTVFATAYDDHALQAFEVHALDYLLKPFAAARFSRVLDRVRRRLRESTAPDLDRLMRHLRDQAPPDFARRLRLSAGPEREVFLAVNNIKLLRADGNYVRVLTRDGRELSLRSTLTDLASKLDPEDFQRINRSEVVRLDAVAELQPWFHGDYRVKMQDGEVLAWSRRYRAKSDL
jgi:two-component system LytT family response regulator